MQKALFIAVFSLFTLNFITPAYALTACANGDKFDIFTGKPCVVTIANPSESDKDALIISLKNQISILQSQINSLKAGGVASSVSDKEVKLRDIDSQILPLLSKIDTLDIDNYIKKVNTILSYYKITDPSTKFSPLVKSSEGYAVTQERADNLKNQIEDYINYRTF